MQSLLRGEEGATAVEYGIMVVLIAVAIVGTVTVLGLGVDGLFSPVADTVSGAAG